MTKKTQIKPTPEEIKKWQEEWTKLVHEGACCAQEDPHKEEKQAFWEDIKKKHQK